MSEEQIELRAEESAKQNCPMPINWNEIDVAERAGYIKGYIAGATENGIQWHNLRKDPNDLPKDRHNVLIIYLNGYYKRERTFASYRHKYWVICGYKTECEVIAWCEIPQFKEE